jgi:hypothetical protein
MEIKISAKLFAEFVVGGPAKKASTVRNILRPKSPEAQIPPRYYTRAIGIIRAYHDQGNDGAGLRNEIRALQQEMLSCTTSQGRTKRSKNLQAIDAYMRVFADRKWKVVRCPRIYYSCFDVRISGIPDLAVQDEERLRLVKLGVRKEKESEEVVRLMLRVIYQAAATKLKINPQDITYFDVSNGEAITGERSDPRLEGTIDNGCRTLRQMIEGKAA